MYFKSTRDIFQFFNIKNESNTYFPFKIKYHEIIYKTDRCV